jgi:hypothetical protein
MLYRRSERTTEIWGVTMRAQTDLPALGLAFVLLTSVVVLGVTVANSSLASAERPALERQTAASLSDRLVSADASLTTSANVLTTDELWALDVSTLRDQYGLDADTAVRVRLDGDVLATTGNVTRGTTVERIVLVENRTTRTIQPEFDSSRTTILPRRTSNVRLTITPPSGTTVRSVLANGRVLLTNSSGLEGTFTVTLSPLSTTELRFETTGPLTEGSVQLAYAPPETHKAILEVTVDA